MQLPLVIQELFGLSAPVSAKRYWTTGAVLGVGKYAIDAGLVMVVTGKLWLPSAYLNPLLTVRQQGIEPLPYELVAALVVTTLPFMWVGASMSVRRAVDAGYSAALGLLFFVPFVNYLAMLALSLLPTVPAAVRDPAPVADVEGAIKTSLLGIAIATGLGLAMMALSVFGTRSYGNSLFFLTPVLMGATSSWLHNRAGQQSLRSSFGVAALSVGITGVAMLLFALEGVVCLVMAMPIAMVAALLGAVVGRAMAGQQPVASVHLAIPFLVLPALVGAEHLLPPQPEHEVVSHIEISAPPAKVWRHVTSFGDLTEPPQWFFALGIAYPKRATISGTGVGAVRRCEFSTGPFIEPITVWDPPRRLAFAVAYQPPPMTELSPYRHVAAPHLEGYMTSRRGEFALTSLANGHTLLHGSTWYTLAIGPTAYWQLWADALVHAIHMRVLRHIAAEVATDTDS
ncbi:MAG: hypothetical protein EXR77_11300 [Myxococcales bacterium]|nr:hypothetical protein [Myxococcales bacterium]